MNTVYRLEKERYAASAFQGLGSLKVSGRWHHRGTQVAYASEHPALAALEKLVWLGSYEEARASTYLLLPLRFDPEKHLEEVPLGDLPKGWDGFPHAKATMDIGTRWAEEMRSAMLSVPSAVMPAARNYLINPAHPDFGELERGDPIPFTWDARLFSRL